MTDTGSFSSLQALIDNHLSKTSIQGSRSEDAGTLQCGIQIPSLRSIETGTQSDTKLSYSPGQRLPIPTLRLSESPIENVLAEQIANMLRAKEKKQKEIEEQQKLAEELKKIKIDEDDDNKHCVIDLMQALKTQFREETPPQPLQQALSNSSSLESLFEPKFIDCELNSAKYKSISPEPVLPCVTDMSYILKKKVSKGKCSPFGKVLTSRYRPVSAPYLREKIENNIVMFDFSTKSPCDLIKEKLRKPCSHHCQFDPTEIITLV